MNINNKLQVNVYGALFRYTRTVAISIGQNIFHSFYFVFGILQSKNLQLHLKKSWKKKKQNITVTGTNWINDSHCLLHTEIDSESMLRTTIFPLWTFHLYVKHYRGTWIWSMCLSIGPIYQSLWLLSWFPWRPAILWWAFVDHFRTFCRM